MKKTKRHQFTLKEKRSGGKKSAQVREGKTDYKELSLRGLAARWGKGVDKSE